MNDQRGISGRVLNGHNKISGEIADMSYTSSIRREIVDSGLEFTGEERCEVGGVAGSKRCYTTALVDGNKVGKEVFSDDSGVFTAVRLTMEATREVLTLGDVIPFNVVNPQGLKLHGASASDWDVYRQSRQKNDIPGFFRPSDDDMDYAYAKVDGAEIKAGMGVSAEDAEKAAAGDVIKAEPVMAMFNKNKPQESGLFIAILGQSEHLSQIRFGYDQEENVLNLLDVVCEFDESELPCGQSRSTHWIIVSECDDIQEKMEWYAELLFAEENIVKTDHPVPSVYCSWYFYGDDFRESDLKDNLADLKVRHIPFDVLLIDHGWMDNFGDWNTNERFPSGMDQAAKMISDAGYKPGIWTCPFVLSVESEIIKKHPELVARDANGEICIFPHSDGDKYILDPTTETAKNYIISAFSKFKEWGYYCHKLDFLRALLNAPNIQFADKSLTRIQAYRLGLSYIREAVGEESYILACGGVFEGSAGLVDAVRIGSDVKGRWHEPAGGKTFYQKMGHLVRIRQNIMRSYTNKFWHSDPDALQIRKRDEAFRGKDEFYHLSDGSFTDEQAFTCVVNQFIGGGLTCFSEHMPEFQSDRLELLKHVIPAYSAPLKVVDIKSKECPEMFVSDIDNPSASELGKWKIATVCNWKDEDTTKKVDLSGVLSDDKKYAAFEFKTQQYLGIYDASDSISIEVPGTGARVIKLVEIKGDNSILLGTDCHLTSGATEFKYFDIAANCVSGETNLPWERELTFTVGVPNNDKLEVKTYTVPQSTKTFSFSI